MREPMGYPTVPGLYDARGIGAHEPVSMFLLALPQFRFRNIILMYEYARIQGGSVCCIPKVPM